MYKIPFSFPIINVVNIYGEDNKNTIEVLLELNEVGSNQFVIVYNKFNTDLEDTVKHLGINTARKYMGMNPQRQGEVLYGVLRGGYLHHLTPDPEITPEDYANMLNIITDEFGCIPKNSYLVWAVDLVSGIIHFDLLYATSIKEARNKAKDFLTNYIGTQVYVRNLMLSPNKNSDIGHTSNLSASYVGRISRLNKYYSKSRFHVGCVKASITLTDSKINHQWVYNCI